jgi:hypothetical protein
MNFTAILAQKSGDSRRLALTHGPARHEKPGRAAGMGYLKDRSDCSPGLKPSVTVPI